MYGETRPAGGAAERLLPSPTPMRLCCLALLLSLTTAASAQDRGCPVATWYAVTSGETTEMVRATSLQIVSIGGRQTVIADGKEWAFREAVQVEPRGTGREPTPEGDHGRAVAEVIIRTSVGADGTVTQRVISNTKNADGSTSHTQTETTTTSDGETSSTSTTTTTSGGGESSGDSPGGGS